MEKILTFCLILGFLMVDFFFFHDILKAGETITFSQYLVGILSIPVMLLSTQSLIRKAK